MAEVNNNEEETIDNVFFFASDGGEMEMGYDYSENKYLWVDSIEKGIEPPEYLGSTCEEFLNFLIGYFEE